MSICEVLKQARSDAELSQEAAAEKVGVSRQTMSNWETGKSYPDIASVIALSDAYGVSLDSLMKGDTKMIKHLEESTNVTKSNKQVIATIIAIAIAIIGTALIILASGGDYGDFIDLPSWVALIIPMLAVLTITRSFRVFGAGFNAALFPKKEISDELRTKAVSLFRLLSKIVILSAVIVAMIFLTNMAFGIDYNGPHLFENLVINIAICVMPILYSLFLIVFIFEPIVYILRNKTS
ncbi:MAG: helix-turn-helix domain-containing protein [Oscillospiraceae bacterium]|nr:helix-turn-helix domain-containing protein [Oscillospiraceae bacterium]